MRTCLHIFDVRVVRVVRVGRVVRVVRVVHVVRVVRVVRVVHVVRARACGAWSRVVGGCAKESPGRWGRSVGEQERVGGS